MINACASLSKKFSFTPFSDSESWHWNGHDQAGDAIAPTNAMRLRGHVSHKHRLFDGMMVPGCSMGYHALQFFLQHPDATLKVISSVVSLRRTLSSQLWHTTTMQLSKLTSRLYLESKRMFINRCRNSSFVRPCAGGYLVYHLYSSQRSLWTRNKFSLVEWGHDAHDWNGGKQCPIFDCTHKRSRAPEFLNTFFPPTSKLSQQAIIELANEYSWGLVSIFWITDKPAQMTEYFPCR